MSGEQGSGGSGTYRCSCECGCANALERRTCQYCDQGRHQATLLNDQELAQRYRSFAEPDEEARLRSALTQQLALASFAADQSWPKLRRTLMAKLDFAAIAEAAHVARLVHAQFAEVGPRHADYARWYADVWPQVVMNDLVGILETIAQEASRADNGQEALDRAVAQVLRLTPGYLITRSVGRPARTWPENEALVLEGRGHTTDRITVLGARWRRRLAKAAPLAWQLAGGEGNEIPPLHAQAGLRRLGASDYHSRGSYVDGHVIIQTRPIILARLARGHRWPEWLELTDQAFQFEPCLSDPFGRPSPLLTLLHEMVHATTSEARSPDPNGEDAAMIAASPSFARACTDPDATISILGIYASDGSPTRSQTVFREVLTQLAALDLESALRAQTPDLWWPAINERKDANSYQDGAKLMEPLLARAGLGALELLHHHEPWLVLLRAAQALLGDEGAEALMAEALEPMGDDSNLSWLAYDFAHRHLPKSPDPSFDLTRIGA
jgi:hypothetical protein